MQCCYERPPRIIYACDLPLSHPNSVAYYLICQVARENGVIVLLSGEGADELFGGYRWRYRRHRNLLWVLRVLDRLPRKVRRGIQMAAYASAGMHRVRTRRSDAWKSTWSGSDPRRLDLDPGLLTAPVTATVAQTVEFHASGSADQDGTRKRKGNSTGCSTSTENSMSKENG